MSHISNTLEMYSATVAELEKDKTQTAKATSSSTPEEKVPATVGAAATHHTDTSANTNAAQPTVNVAAAAMLGNMPLQQAQNSQSVHTNQSKNDNISE